MTSHFAGHDIAVRNVQRMCAVVCGKHEEVTSDASVKRDYDAQGLSPAKRAEKRGRGTPGENAARSMAWMAPVVPLTIVDGKTA